MKHYFTKILHVRTALMLLATAVITMTTQTAWAWNGSGTQSSPYQITTTNELKQLAEDVHNGNTYSGKYFKLMNDLVFTTSTSNWYAISPTFASIGTDTNPFEGTFDGDNHTLTGVYIYRALNNKDDLYQGLFGVIGSGGVVKNIILTDSKIAASNYSAGIAGENRGTITNCHVTSSVTVAPQRDYIHNVTYESCYIGGIAGNNASGATISKCSSGALLSSQEITTGNSSGNKVIRMYGGIAGVNSGNLNNCFAKGVIIGYAQWEYGAIASWNNNGTLANNYYADCSIWSQSSNVGTTTSDGQVDVTTNDGAVRVRLITLSDLTTSSATVFTIPAHKELSGSSIVSVAAVNYNLAKVGATVTLGHGEHSIDSYFFSNYTVKDADDGNVTVNGNNFTMPDNNVTATAVFTDVTWSGSGDSENDPYLITSPEQLILLARRVNNGTGPKGADYEIYYGKFFKVTKDITFTASTSWDNASSTENNYTAIGGVMVGTTRYEFAGTFDGGGKTIKGIRIYQPDSYYEGLFGHISSDAVVKNVLLNDTRITAEGAGGIVRTNSGTVINCAVGSNVSIVGKKFGDQIHGGIASNNFGTIEGCRSLANLTYNGNASIYWGAIAGSNSGTLKNNIAYGATVNSNKSGAIVGKQNGGTLISNYYYNCTIDGVENASNVGVTYEENGTYVRSDVDGARKGVLIGVSSNAITIQPTGEATTYNLSKITGYEGNNVLKFLTLFFSGANETVSLGLTHSSANGNVVKYYDGNDNELTNVGDNTYTYTMTNQALSISAKLIPDWAQKNTGDTEEDAYVISNADQLNLLSERVNSGNTYANKYFKLGANITYNKNTANNFTPIGISGHPFSGHFNGNEKTISGININLPEGESVGLFGYTNGAEIYDLTLDNSSISGYSTVGGIVGDGNTIATYAGRMISTIRNCFVTGSVNVTGVSDNTGGICGEAGSVEGCRSEANVKGKRFVGGITGYLEVNQAIKNSIYTGNSITGTEACGAIVGVNNHWNGNCGDMQSNYYTAELSCKGANGGDYEGARKAVEITSSTGGLILKPTTDNDAYAQTYSVSRINTFTGSIAIEYNGGASSKYYAGEGESVNLNITYTYTSPYEGFIFEGYTDGNGNALTHVEGTTYKLTMPATTAYITPDGQDLWGENGTGRDGSTAEKAYRITTPEGLNLLAKKVNGTDGYEAKTYSGKFFELGDNIEYDKTDLYLDGGKSNYVAIGTENHRFSGTFDGKGHKISGIVIDKDANFQGLFGYLEGAEVKNLTIDDATITIGGGKSEAGGIAGHINSGSTIENCHATNSVTVTAQTGGSQGYKVGGIVGRNWGTVSGCTSAATVSGTEEVGGIVGNNASGTTKNCLVLAANVSANSNAGAIVGRYYDSGTLTNNRYTAATTVNAGTAIGHGVGGIGNDIPADIDGGATVAYEFPIDIDNFATIVGTAADTYGTGDYQGITAYKLGDTYTALAYDGKLYYPSLWTGNGDENDPYVIYSPEGLDKLANDVNNEIDYSRNYFILGADISYNKNALTLDLDDESGMDSNFPGIGYSYYYTFLGYFDGRGHTISGLVIKRPDSDRVGLFGNNVYGVKNLTLANCAITGRNYTGGIVGYGDRFMLIENCHVLGDVIVSGERSVGGILGECGNISGCTSAAAVSGSDNRIGGIIGYSSYDNNFIKDCLYYGTSVTGGSYVGSIAGDKHSSSNFSNNYYTAYGLACKGINGSDTDGALFAVSSTTQPAAITGDATATYGTGSYTGITAYQNGLFYNGRYYWHDDDLFVISNDGTTNTTAINAAYLDTRNVILSGRTLYKDGGWNTLCLPFELGNMSADSGHYFDGTPLEGAEVRKLMSAGIEGSTLTLTFNDPSVVEVNLIEAGRPYIVKWPSGEDVNNPVFTGVKIYNNKLDFTTGSGDTKVQFIGTYDKVTFEELNRSILFVGAENTLYYPDGSDVTTIGACRAYFKIGDGANARQITDFDFNFDGDGETTAVFDLNNNEQITNNRWYTLDGRKLDTKPTQKGLYIVNGKKVVIK